jgi:orotate phosphoribosyltransferase
VHCVEEHGGVVVGVGSLIDRSGGTAAFSVKRVALATITAATYPPEACPLCTAGSVAIKPGSRS